MGEPLNEAQQRGLTVLREMLGDSFADTVAKRIGSDGVGVAMSRNALESTFAAVWGRPGLDRRSRSLVTIGALIAAGATHELGNHFRIALRHGLTLAELEEVVMHTQPYVGFAAAGPAMHLLAEIAAAEAQLTTAKD